MWLVLSTLLFIKTIYKCLTPKPCSISNILMSKSSGTSSHSTLWSGQFSEFHWTSCSSGYTFLSCGHGGYGTGYGRIVRPFSLFSQSNVFGLLSTSPWFYPQSWSFQFHSCSFQLLVRTYSPLLIGKQKPWTHFWLTHFY